MKTYARVKECLCFGDTSKREWKEVKKETMRMGRNCLYFVDDTREDSFCCEIISVII